MEKQSFIKDKTFNRLPTKYPISCQMPKKKLVIFLLALVLSIGLFVVAGVVFTPNSDSPDADFSNTKIITLNITQKDNFERLINVDFSKVNDTRFQIDLKVNETLMADIQTCRALSGASKLTCFGNIKTTYFSDITLQDILDSLNNIASFPATNLTTGIKLEKNSMDLSTGTASFYVDLIDYDKANLAKSVGERFKVGLHSITIETVESTNDVGKYSSIALDSNGVVHISHVDDTNNALRYCNNTGGSWTCANAATTITTTIATSIAIDSNNIPHIAFGDDGTKLRYCNRTANVWSCATVQQSASTAQFGSPSIAINSSNSPIIAFANISNLMEISCANTAGTWTCVNVENGDNPPSIAIDSNNFVHLAYNNDSLELRYCNNTGGSWTCASISGFSGDSVQATPPSIAIDSNNVPHILVTDNSNNLNYFNRTGGTLSGGVISGLTSTYEDSPAISIGANNIPFIAYVDYFPADGDYLYFGKKLSTGWTASSLGRFVTIALPYSLSRNLALNSSVSSRAHISFYNKTDADLIYLSPQLYTLDINLLTPKNSSWLNSNTSIQLNFTISNETTLSQCIYNFNTTNISIANCQNTTFTTPNGNYLLNLWINDSAGSMVLNSTNFTIDSTFPLISFSSTQDANNTNFSRNWIFINTTSTEINFANITYRIANSTNITTAVYTSYTNTSNFTGRVDGVYSYNVTIVDLATNSNTTETRTIRLDNTVPSISVFDPDPVVYASNQSIPLNFTSSDAVVGLANSTYQVLNASGGAVIVANTTLTGNTTFNASTGDWTYNFTLWSTDLLNQIGRVDVQFSVDMTGPAVVLDSPVSNANLSNGSSVYLNFTATKTGGVSQCQLWGNFTGTWHKNYTWTTITTAVQNYTTLNFTNSNNLWNVWCNDTSNNERWALNNLTFLVDLTYPNVSIDSITTTAGSQTISFNSTQTDSYGTLKSCKYSIYDATNAIDGANENVSMTCNGNPNSASVSAYATYKLRVYALDYANNENSTNLSFTTSATAGGTTGGGSGGTPPAEDTGFCGDNLCKEDRGETFNSCPEDCAQLNFNFDSFLFNCLDGKENDCFWERNTGLLFGVLFLVGFLLFSLLFKVEPEKKGIKKIVYVPPKIFKKRRSITN